MFADPPIRSAALPRGVREGHRAMFLVNAAGCRLLHSSNARVAAQRPRPRIQAKSIEHVFHLGPSLPHPRPPAHFSFANLRIFAKLSAPAAPHPDSPAGTAGRNCSYRP
jgi:hypothetical protein